LANFFQKIDLAKYPRWLILVGVGLVAVVLAVICATAMSVHIVGVDIKLTPEGASRYVCAGVLGTLGIALIGFGLNASRTEQTEADLKRVPVDQIEIKNVRPGTPRPHDPQYWVSGQVTPPMSRVKVWLLREERGQQTGKFTLNGVGHATTDDKGHWEQSIIMWHGTFDIHAVVTTEENERFYRWAIRAREAALKIVRKHNPDTYDVLDWPPFDFLPDPRRSDKHRIDV
jgi:hypothetical protein